MISIAACRTEKDAMEYCKKVALGLGLTLGKEPSYPFAKDSYVTKGCYYYRNGSPYAGSAFFGLGGSRDDWKGTGESLQVRIPVDFETCRIKERFG